MQRRDIFWKHQPVLITGATGFLGSHLAETLERFGANVFCLTRDLSKKTYLHTTGVSEKVTVCVGDVTDCARMREILLEYDISYVFHCAAHSIVSKCSKDPIGCFHANVMGTASLLEAVREAGGSVRGVMCMESDKAYGSFDVSDLPYREDQALKPRHVYETSKTCAGLIARTYYWNYGVPVFTVRAANFYGPGDMNTSRIIPNSILRILRGEQPVLYGAVADYEREFLFIEDAVDAIISLMERIGATKGEAINLGSGQTFKIKDLMHTIGKELKTNVSPIIASKEDAFKEIPMQYLDLTKLKRFLPFYSPMPFHRGLRKTVSWYAHCHTQGIFS